MAARRGRPRNAVEGSGLTARQARRLRAVVEQADLTLVQLRERTGYSLATLSKAMGGVDLPTWPVTTAILEACKLDPAGWEEDWQEAAAEPPPLRLVKNADDNLPVFLPLPPKAAQADRQLAIEVTRAMDRAADSGVQPNLIKIARELGISPALMNDTIEAMGGFNTLWARAQQDQSAALAEGQRLVARLIAVINAAAAAHTQPNLIKLARELGISPALMNDTIEAMGGFNALWARAQQGGVSADHPISFVRPPVLTPRFAGPPSARSKPRFGPSPIPVGANTVAQFNAHIVRVHIWIGTPSVRELARAMDIAPSTMQNLLHPKNPDRLPDYDKLIEFLRYTEMDSTALSEWVFTWRRLKYTQVTAQRAEVRAAKMIPDEPAPQTEVPQADAA